MRNKTPAYPQSAKANPEIPIADSTQPIRALTLLELSYARSHLRLKDWARYVICLIGLAFMLAGLAFAILGVEASQTDQIDLFITVLIPPLVLACLGAGATLIYYGWKRKHALLDGAFEFDGILTEQVTRVINPKTGQVSTNYQYRIGDANIIWPPGAQPIYKPVVNERIQVTAAQITRSNPIALFGGKSKFDEQPRDAVDLEFRDRIRIHYAVQKYGKNMFLIYHAQMILAGIVGAALLLGGVLYVVFTQEIYRQSIFIQISLIIGLTVGFCFVLLVIFFVLNRIAKPPASE